MAPRTRARLTYVNVVSTLALLLALGAGVVYAARKIHTRDIAAHAVTTRKLAKGAVKTHQLANGAVTSLKIKDGAVTPAKVSGFTAVTARLHGGSLPVAGGPKPYPFTPTGWNQSAGESELVFARITATLAAVDTSNPPFTCDASIGFTISGLTPFTNSLPVSSASATPQAITVSGLIAVPSAADTTLAHNVDATLSDNGNCTSQSQIDSFTMTVVGLS
jgi:hypothetical protein